MVACGLVWAGVRISRREGKGDLVLVENVVALAISVLILWAAVGIFRRVSAAVDAPITNLAIAIGGSLVAALVSYHAAQYRLYVGREVGSLSLIADGHHSRMDTLTTGAVVVAIWALSGIYFVGPARVKKHVVDAKVGDVALDLRFLTPRE